MKTVGLRQLRQHASEVLRRVEAGATVDVTSRGRTVARLVPVAQARTRDRLIAQGRLRPAAGDVLSLGPPIRARRSVELPGEALARAREFER